jgi:uncharacterized membrane protein
MDTENKKLTKKNGERLNSHLSIAYFIGLIVTVLFIAIGFITHNDLFYILSVVFLIITPTAGLFLSLTYYIRNKNTKNILVTTAVLVILAISATIGFLNFS